MSMVGLLRLPGGGRRLPFSVPRLAEHAVISSKAEDVDSVSRVPQNRGYRHRR